MTKDNQHYKAQLQAAQAAHRRSLKRQRRGPAVLKRKGFSAEQNDAVISVVMDLVEQMNVVLKPFEIEITVQ